MGIDTEMQSNVVVETDAPDTPDAGTLQKMNLLHLNATWYEIENGTVTINTTINPMERLNRMTEMVMLRIRVCPV